MRKIKIASIVRVLLAGVFLVILTGGKNIIAHAQQKSVNLPGSLPQELNIQPDSPAICPPSIEFGETIQCSISAVGEVDIYSFTASASDHVYVRMTTSSGTVWPYVQIYKPDGTSPCGAVNVLDHSTVSTTCTLPVDGTYTIRSRDYDNAGIGDYYLYIQRTNNPGNPVSIGFGDTLADSILTPAQNDTYTFSGIANDVVFVRLSAAYWAYIQVYKPDGISLCSAYNALSRHRVDVTCILPVDGIYIILVGDQEGAGTGEYHLYLQRLNNPINPPTISYGQTVPGTISAPAEMDTFFFSGEAGDQLVAKMGATSPVYTYLNVFNPDGTKLCGAHNALDSNHVELNCTLTSTGIHTILAGDYDAAESGDYHVYIQRLKNPGNTVPLDFGTTHSDSIDTPVDTDTYTFDAEMNDRILARIASTSSVFSPRMYLYDPDGTRICSLTVTFIDSCLIPATGTYTILALDTNNIYTGDYFLYLQRLNNPSNATPISYGQTLLGVITQPAEMGTYTFNGLTNERVFVRMSKAAGVYTRPGIRIYNPDGTARCWTNGDTIAEIPYCTLYSDGTYTILANDYYGEDIGSYRLFLQGLNHPGNAIPITSGQTRNGSILVIGEVDTYTFTASSGDHVKLKMERAPSDTLWPRITVYDPAGMQVCSAWGYAIAEITNCALLTTGIYAVFLDDYNYQIHTGNYTIYFENLTNPGNPQTYKSTGAQDGWILESTENSNTGGAMNATAGALSLGDNAQKKQYRSILSFNTSSLPDNAVITKVTLKLKKHSVVGGGNPVAIFQGFMVDIKKGMFGTAPLALADFKATASKTVGPQSPALTTGWYSLNLTPAKAYINKLGTNSGLTQMRLRFKLDDNNNAVANILNLVSGNNVTASNRPTLIIEYYVP